jgi:hypothetical protein
MRKLVEVIESPRAGKKWRAVFNVDGKMMHTDFGASGMEDYTMHHDTERRRLYRARHAKDLSTGDPTRAGFLSYYVLWGDSTSMAANVRAYKQRFAL